MAKSSAAIRMGTPGPPSLGTFLLERELWKQLGLRREDLVERPRREVEDYLLFIELICREERKAQAQNRRASRGSR